MKILGIIGGVIGVLAAVAVGIIGYIGSQPPMMPFLCYSVHMTCPTPIINGTVLPEWELVLDTWRKNFHEGYELGAQINVIWMNTHVVDVVLGYSDPTFKAPFRNETLQMVFSSSKVVESLVIAMLVDRGHIKYSDKIASFWPEFAVNGKKHVTVGDLMSNGGGLHTIGQSLDLETLQNQEKLSKVLAEAPLNEKSFRQKGKQAYHAISRGLYSSQICRRVDPKHRSLKKFAEEEIFEPLNITFKFGVKNASEVGGMYGLSKLKTYTGLVPRLILPNWLSSIIYSDQLMTPSEKRAINDARKEGTVSKGAMSVFAPQFAEYSDWVNTPGWSDIESPSSHGFTTASAMARIGNVLLNQGADPFSEVRLLTPEGVVAAETPSSLGYANDELMGIKTVYTEAGWGDRMIEVSDGHKCIGWGGSGGSLFQWCPSVSMAFSYVPNYYSINQPDWRGALYLKAAHSIAAKKTAKLPPPPSTGLVDPKYE